MQEYSSIDNLLFVVFGFLLILWPYSSTAGVDSAEVRAKFEEEYNRPIKEPLSIRILRSTIGPEEWWKYRRIADLGPAVIPHIIEKMEAGDFFITLSLQMITKKFFEKEEYKSFGCRDSRDEAKLYIYWWREGRKQTPQRFKKLYTEWQSLRKEGETEKAKEKYQWIIDMGIIVLPYLIEKISEGDTALIPAVSELTDGEVKEDATPEECVRWWKENKERWYIPIEGDPGEEEIKKDDK
ncbi:MAG TPA: hypothetical protein ENI34_10390 [candidate division WOR-3 bacterium]|uniref:Uncharacterized protein n=1 Tax=candidate division WOR-3 bacterium TaxID=2052148 RepID=A0A9C9K0Z1_UNCW3|nr:hypothetical protein [candidate division WOR-3 bacterium]